MGYEGLIAFQFVILCAFALKDLFYFLEKTAVSNSRPQQIINTLSKIKDLGEVNNQLIAIINKYKLDTSNESKTNLISSQDFPINHYEVKEKFHRWLEVESEINSNTQILSATMHYCKRTNPEKTYVIEFKANGTKINRSSETIHIWAKAFAYEIERAYKADEPNTANNYKVDPIFQGWRHGALVRFEVEYTNATEKQRYVNLEIMEVPVYTFLSKDAESLYHAIEEVEQNKATIVPYDEELVKLTRVKENNVLH